MKSFDVCLWWKRSLILLMKIVYLVVESIFFKSVPSAFVYNVSHPNLNINGSGVAERFPGAVIRPQ